MEGGNGTLPEKSQNQLFCPNSKHQIDHLDKNLIILERPSIFTGRVVKKMHAESKVRRLRKK